MGAYLCTARVPCVTLGGTVYEVRVVVVYLFVVVYFLLIVCTAQEEFQVP